MSHALDGDGPRRTRRQRTRWATQDAALASIMPAEGTLEARVLDAIRERPSTCDELEERLALTHQTCSARVHHLMAAGLIVADGSRRTRSGRAARVWRAREAANLWEVRP